MNLYHVTKFPPYFSPTLYCFYAKMSSFIPVLTIGIVLDSFYLLVFYSEKFSAWVWILPFAVNVNLNLSLISPFPYRGAWSQATTKLTSTQKTLKKRWKCDYMFYRACPFDVWHHPIRKPPLLSVHTKICVSGDRFQRIRVDGRLNRRKSLRFQTKTASRCRHHCGPRLLSSSTFTLSC